MASAAPLRVNDETLNDETLNDETLNDETLNDGATMGAALNRLGRCDCHFGSENWLNECEVGERLAVEVVPPRVRRASPRVRCEHRFYWVDDESGASDVQSMKVQFEFLTDSVPVRWRPSADHEAEPGV